MKIVKLVNQSKLLRKQHLMISIVPNVPCYSNDFKQQRIESPRTSQPSVYKQTQNSSRSSEFRGIYTAILKTLIFLVIWSLGLNYSILSNSLLNSMEMMPNRKSLIHIHPIRILLVPLYVIHSIFWPLKHFKIHIKTKCFFPPYLTMFVLCLYQDQ